MVSPPVAVCKSRFRGSTTFVPDSLADEAQNLERLPRGKWFRAAQDKCQSRILCSLAQDIGIDKLKDWFQRLKARELRGRHRRTRGRWQLKNDVQHAAGPERLRDALDQRPPRDVFE